MGCRRHLELCRVFGWAAQPHVVFTSHKETPHVFRTHRQPSTSNFHPNRCCILRDPPRSSSQDRRLLQVSHKQSTMAPPQPNGDATPLLTEGDLAQAFKDLARGEETASALEQHLDALEEKIEELLARAEENQRSIEAENGQPSQQISSTQNQENRKSDGTGT